MPEPLSYNTLDAEEEVLMAPRPDDAPRPITPDSEDISDLEEDRDENGGPVRKSVIDRASMWAREPRETPTRIVPPFRPTSQTQWTVPAVPEAEIPFMARMTRDEASAFQWAIMFNQP